MPQLTRAKSFTTLSSVTASVKSYADMASMNRLSRSMLLDTQRPTTASSHNGSSGSQSLHDLQYSQKTRTPIFSLTRSSTILRSSLSSGFRSLGAKDFDRSTRPRNAVHSECEESSRTVLQRAKTFVAKSLDRTKRSVQVRCDSHIADVQRYGAELSMTRSKSSSALPALLLDSRPAAYESSGRTAWEIELMRALESLPQSPSETLPPRRYLSYTDHRQSLPERQSGKCLKVIN